MSRLFTATRASCARLIVSAFQSILLRKDIPSRYGIQIPTGCQATAYCDWQGSSSALAL
jgi:hypothetical protein